MVMLPAFLGFMIPLELTDAILGFEDFQLTVLLGTPVTFNCFVSLVYMVSLLLFKEILFFSIVIVQEAEPLYIPSSVCIFAVTVITAVPAL